MATQRPATEQIEQQRFSMSGGAIAALGGLVLLAVFMVQNTEKIEVSLLFWNLNTPVWLLTLGTAALGAVVSYGVGVFRRRRNRAA